MTLTLKVQTTVALFRPLHLHTSGWSISRGHGHASHERSSTSKPAEPTALPLRHRFTAASRLANENPVSGYQPADRDRHVVGVAEEEIAWRRFWRPHSTKGEDIQDYWKAYNFILLTSSAQSVNSQYLLLQSSPHAQLLQSPLQTSIMQMVSYSMTYLC